MSKIMILGDLHVGVKQGNIVMMEQHLRYIEEQFIPYILSNNIKTIIQTGDMFDCRKGATTLALMEWKLRFFDVLLKHDIQLHTYIGNHDMFYRNQISPNTTTEYLSHYNNINIIEKPSNVTIEGCNFLIIPWICNENEEACMDAIQTSKSNICIGHFEIKGAKMEGTVCTDGLPISTFDRFERCISGHFHIKGDYENVSYVGTPTQSSWGDYGVNKGVHVLDTETLDLDFIINTEELFHKITYNEDRDMKLVLSNDYTNKYIKVVIEHRVDFKKYEKWMMQVEDKGAASLTVIEPFLDRSSDDSEVEVDGALDVLTTDNIIKQYIAEVYPEKAEALTTFMLGIHTSAIRDY